MYLDLITNRNLAANVGHGIVYEIEDLLVSLCSANLVYPIPRAIYKRATLKPSKFSEYTLKLINKTIGVYRPITVRPPARNGSKVLGLICLNGSDLFLLDAIKDWRRHYDIVFAYVMDCWLYESYPKFTSQLDHIFIPFPEEQESLAAHLHCPVSVVPYGANNLDYSSTTAPRSIDIVSYGRTANNYYQGLFSDFHRNHPELLVYQFGVGAFPTSQVFPKTEWGERRFDFQNRVMLPRILRRSKIALAFENLYTTRVNSNANRHMIHRAQHSYLAFRWFECSGAGCAVVGKHPHGSLLEQYMGWEDATIELPDDVDEGIAMIHALLEDTEKLAAIHRRNYLENLARNDWRHRFKAIFDILELPIPDPLAASLKVLDSLYASGYHQIEAKPL